MSLIDTTAETLRLHAPFDRMQPKALRWLAARLQLAFYAKGRMVLTPAHGVVDRLNIVKQGVVRGEAAAAMRSDALVPVVLGPGECFPVGAMMGRRPSAYDYSAAEDSFVYELGADDFRQLLDLSPEFARFCTEYLAMLVDESRRALRSHLAETLAEESQMTAPLRKLVARPPVSCAPETPLREVLRTMHTQRIGCMVAVDSAGRPVGILTQPDVLERVALRGASLDAPLSAVMTPTPIVIAEDAAVFEGVLARARHGIRHLLLVKDGKLSGVVSERDLYAMHRTSPRRASEHIRRAETFDALADAAGEVRGLTQSLVAHGVGAEHLTLVITALNDGIVRRALALAAERHAVGTNWCWIALGSEGRMEQTLVTDQDNGLIIGAAADKQLFLAFADEVNRALERCGVPLCKGNVMARNPLWCLTLEEWRLAFSHWIRNPVPEALLNAAIFFDLRAIDGDASLASELHGWLLASSAASPMFLRAMAENALIVKPPVGLLHDLVGSDEVIDLKMFGVRPFVDVARVWALSKSLPSTGTAERLRAAAAAGVLPADEASAYCEAFHFLQAMRMRVGGNLVDARALNRLDHRILKEAFRQAAAAQQRLRIDYQL